MTAIKETEEYKRLHPEDTEQKWRKWGPYLSNRQWGTVREHYSNDKPAWGAFTYDQARSIAYRWGEDGILGISDDTQELCFALALWNGQQDDHIKERFFGLPGLFGEHGGIHGEDVKEYYFYLDSTPTHSYMKALYKYPATQFPIADLIEKNDSRRERGKSEPEYELIDTGIFEKGYFDITVEYAKAQWDDILIKIEVVNRSIHGKSQLHLLPTLWFRNTWSWKNNEGRPDISEQNGALCAEYNRDKKKMYLHYEMLDEFHGVYFTDNESETGENRRPPITGRDEIITSRFFKNGIDRYLTGQDYTNRNNPDFISNWINPNRNGTKASVHYSREFSKETDCWRIRLRLSSRLGDNDRFGDFDEHLERCRQEANDFFDALTPPTPPPHFVKIIEKGEKVEEKWDDWRNIQRQALAGLL